MTLRCRLNNLEVRRSQRSLGGFVEDDWHHFSLHFQLTKMQRKLEIISADLRHRGLTPAETPAKADVIVANTCSVTAQADRTARAFLRKMHRENPSARILATGGCYAQRAPQELATLPGVHTVIGNSHKALVPELAQQAAGFVPLAGLYVDDAFAHSELAMPQGGWRQEDRGQTRPNLKVQDGCGNRCSFCIIPATRGRRAGRSPWRPASSRVRRRCVDGGGAELVLSGHQPGPLGAGISTPASSASKNVVGAILVRHFVAAAAPQLQSSRWTGRRQLVALLRRVRL